MPLTVTHAEQMKTTNHKDLQYSFIPCHHTRSRFQVQERCLAIRPLRNLPLGVLHDSGSQRGQIMATFCADHGLHDNEWQKREIRLQSLQHQSAKKIIRRTVPTVPMMDRFFTSFHKLTVHSRLENVPIQPTSSYWNQSQIFSARSARNDESLSHSVHSLVRWMSPPPTKSIVNISEKVLTIGCKQLPLQYLPI